MEFTPWKLPSGIYTMEVTSQYLHHESYIVEPTPWKLSHGTYTMEGTLMEYTP